MAQATACTTIDQLAGALADTGVTRRPPPLSLPEIVEATHAVQLQQAAAAATFVPLAQTPTHAELEAMEDEESETAIQLEEAKRRLSILARRHSTVTATLAEGRRRNRNRRERERAAKQDAIRKKLAAEQQHW